MTSDSLSAKFREVLDARPHRDAAAYLNECSPQCECEAAEPCAGGHGPIKKDELLSFYITHPQQTQQRIKDKKELDKLKAEGKTFFYKAQIFDAAFSVGISVMREKHATDAESCTQAGKITNRLRENLPEEGGILGILQFPAGAAFGVVCETGYRHYCVYDTPIDHGKEDAVLAHSDIFATANGSSFEEFRVQRASVRVKLFHAVLKQYHQIDAADYRNGIFEPFLANYKV